MKICNKCSVEKDVKFFGADKRNKDGLQGICEYCRKQFKQSIRSNRVVGISINFVPNKQCNRCKTVKNRDEFFKDSGISDGLATICKTCRKVSMKKHRVEHKEEYNANMRKWRAENKQAAKNHDLWRTYGITLETYNEMLLLQNQVCKMCKKPPRGKRPLVVDHNHITGIIRGLLCYGCNRILHAYDDPTAVNNAAEYLKKS